MRIRPETPADHAAIRGVHRLAFAEHPFSRQTEHKIVDALRAAGALCLSLVAQDDAGAVVGHIAFSAAPVGGRDLGWSLMGPLGVLPAHQRNGVGSALVAAGLEALRGLGARGCVLVGDPAFYTRLGFRQAEGLLYPGVPPEVVLCLPLAREEPAGDIGHHAAFDVEP